MKLSKCIAFCLQELKLCIYAVLAGECCARGLFPELSSTVLPHSNIPLCLLMNRLLVRSSHVAAIAVHQCCVLRVGLQAVDCLGDCCSYTDV